MQMGTRRTPRTGAEYIQNAPTQTFAERPQSQLQNIDLHRRLAEELTKATNEVHQTDL
jgi:hypothetical protein